MKHTPPRRNATTTLALLACIATTAMAQTPPQHWPWGSGFERRNATSQGAQPEVLPADPATTTAAGHTDGRGSKAQGSGAGSGTGGSTGGGMGGAGGGRGNGGNGRGR